MGSIHMEHMSWMQALAALITYVEHVLADQQGEGPVDQHANV